jgi:hypothetical protein
MLQATAASSGAEGPICVGPEGVDDDVPESPVAEVVVGCPASSPPPVPFPVPPVPYTDWLGTGAEQAEARSSPPANAERLQSRECAGFMPCP